MDDQNLYSGFKNTESQLKLLLSRFSELRAGMTKLLEQNEELKIENQHLRELLKTTSSDDAKPIKNAESNKRFVRSRENLQRIYDKGFHVCQQFYGQPRNTNTQCIFCSEEILHRNKTKES